MIFFLDENMPRQVAAVLKSSGECSAEHLLDHLAKGTPDEAVFKFLSTRDWVLLTQDAKISRKPHQRLALIQAGVGAFILTGRATRSLRELLIFTLECLPGMLEHATSTNPPYIFGVSDRKRIERLDAR